MSSSVIGTGPTGTEARLADCISASFAASYSALLLNRELSRLHNIESMLNLSSGGAVSKASRIAIIAGLSSQYQLMSAEWSSSDRFESQPMPSSSLTDVQFLHPSLVRANPAFLAQRLHTRLLVPFSNASNPFGSHRAPQKEHGSLVKALFSLISTCFIVISLFCRPSPRLVVVATSTSTSFLASHARRQHAARAACGVFATADRLRPCVGQQSRGGQR
jgi:hypothetical protein